ncbi:MAG: TIGR03089 family protein [Frankia sp.]|nr:TIGR03089 family protein [Frankia sp.]
MTDRAPHLVPAGRLLAALGTPTGDAPFPGVAAALAARLLADAASPMVTFYDDATGERVELSAATLDNWVAKTANLLVDTLGLAPGDRVGVLLPAHWLTVVVLVAAWSAGMEVAIEPGAAADGGEPVDVQVVFAAESRVDEALAIDADEVVALSLRPLGARLAHPIAGVLDFAAEVPAHGDRFAAPPPPPGQAALLAHARQLADAAGLTAADRLLAAPGTTVGLLAATLVPLACGASLVLCRNLDESALARRLEMERVTASAASATATPSHLRQLALDPTA